MEAVPVAAQTVVEVVAEIRCRPSQRHKLVTDGDRGADLTLVAAVSHGLDW